MHLKMDRVWIFCSLLWGAVAAAPTDVTKTVAEGDSVTLWSGLDNEMDVFLTDKDRNVLLNLEAGKIINKTKNIAVDKKTGNISLVNVRQEDGKVFHLQIIYSDRPITTFNIHLKVTERLHPVTDLSHTPGPAQSSDLAVPLGVGLTVALVIVGGVGVGLLCWKRRTAGSATSTQRSTGPSCSIKVTAADNSGSSSRSDIPLEQQQEEEELVKKAKG